jgi:hypothetical protein
LRSLRAYIQIEEDSSGGALCPVKRLVVIITNFFLSSYFIISLLTKIKLESVDKDFNCDYNYDLLL